MDGEMTQRYYIIMSGHSVLWTESAGITWGFTLVVMNE